MFALSTDAAPLPAFEPEWGTGFPTGPAFTRIIYWNETGDRVKPENMPLAE